MNQSSQLSLEQEFNLRKFSDQVRNLSREQAQDLLIELNKQMMIQQNLYQELLKPYWGIGTTPMSFPSFESDSFTS
ncbi:MAG: NblA/ycf18 family protein [Prochloraceae cyanobacterium]